VVRGLRVPVNLTSRETLRMFDLADIWATRTGKDVRLVSANDHVHSPRSAHYAGRALDFLSSDPHGLSDTFRRAGYRVLWNVPGHYGHVHVEQSGSNDELLGLRPSSEPARTPAARRRARVPVGG
jgi:hypothetical protein